MKDRPDSLLSAEDVGIIWDRDLITQVDGFFWHEGKLRVVYKDGDVWERRYMDVNTWNRVERML